jgi:hypothetical protein
VLGQLGEKAVIQQTERHAQNFVAQGNGSASLEVGAQFEDNLEELRRVLEEFRESAWMVWSEAERQVRATADALCAKEDAVRWKLRIARHCSGPVRAAILSDVQKSVDELEETTESTLRAVARYHGHH